MAEQRVVVVGVDFEANGDEAIRAALGRKAEVPHLHLHFVYAADAAEPPEAFGEVEFDSDEELLEYAQKLLLARIERLASAQGYASLSGLGVAHAAISKPVPLLLSLCARYDAELLIVGTHARRGLDRLMLGSVAEALLRQAPCDVLVARAGSPANRRSVPPPPSHIVREH
jgi:nucleotide-binding universal stress UspA family protein